MRITDEHREKRKKDIPIFVRKVRKLQAEEGINYRYSYDTYRPCGAPMNTTMKLYYDPLELPITQCEIRGFNYDLNVILLDLAELEEVPQKNLELKKTLEAGK